MTTHDLVLSAMFAALIVVLGALPGIPIAFLPVPITLQSLGVMLAGALLGPRRGAAAVLVFIVLVMMGLPVLAGGRGGMGALAAPSAGFILGWVPAAFVTGLLAARAPSPAGGASRAFAGHLLACLAGGIVVDYLCGILWLVAVTGLPPSRAAFGTLAFIPGDLIKAAIASWIAVSIKRVHALEPR